MTQVTEAVLFDYGLVLTGSPDPAAWSQMQALTGLSEETFSRAYWMHRHDYDRGSYTGQEYWRVVGEQELVTLSATQVAELIAADTVLWTQVNQPMVDWAHRLQAAGTRTGILSNLGDEMMHGVLRALPWIAEFDHLLWSHTLKMTKPDPEIYRHAARGLGVPREAILFVDDRPENIEGALRAGMQAILYRDQQGFEQEMQARGLGELWRTGRNVREIAR